MKLILKDWVTVIGLRHQGVLLSAIRGCDSVLREDSSKYLVRVYRGILLNAHCGDAAKASSFITPYDSADWSDYVDEFFRSIDHYPNHWLLHWMHACEIVGYKHPDDNIRMEFNSLYIRLVKKFHLNPETESQLDCRLNADEDKFSADNE